VASLYVACVRVFLSSVWHVWDIYTCMAYVVHLTHCILTVPTHIPLIHPTLTYPILTTHFSLYTYPHTYITRIHPHSHYTRSSHAYHTHMHSPHIYHLTFTHIHTRSHPLTHIHHTHVPHTCTTHMHHTPLTTHPVWTTLTGASRCWKQTSILRLL